MRGEVECEPLTVERWADRALSQSRTVVLSVIVAAMIWRTGMTSYWQPLQYEIAEAFPRPTSSYRGGAVLSPALMTALGLDDGTERGWFAIHLVVTVAAVFAVGVMVWRRFRTSDQRWFVLVGLAASSYPVMLLVRVGHYDVWFLLGAAVVVLGRSWPAALVGGSLMGLTNVEQAFVALVTLAAVAALLDRTLLRSVGLAAGAIFAAWASVQVWYAAYDVEQETRAGLLGENLDASWRGFVRALPVQVFSWFSAAWLAVISVSRTILVFATLVTLPAIMTIITVDGTRVFVACVTPAFLALLSVAARELDSPQLQRLTRWTLILMILTPGVSTFTGGGVPLSWIDYT